MLLSASPDENLRAARANLTRTNGWHIARRAHCTVSDLSNLITDFFPLEIAWGWNAYHQDAAFGSRPLYPAVGELIVNNYPPLSFYVIGWIASWAGNALFVGRALSVAAIFGLGFVIAIIIRQFRRQTRPPRRWAASGSSPPWPVHSISSWVWTTRNCRVNCLWRAGVVSRPRFTRGLSAEPPIILMVVAGFWKRQHRRNPCDGFASGSSRTTVACHTPVPRRARGNFVGLVLWAIYGIFHRQPFCAAQICRVAHVVKPWTTQFVLPALVLWAVWARRRPLRALRNSPHCLSASPWWSTSFNGAAFRS